MADAEWGSVLRCVRCGNEWSNRRRHGDAACGRCGSRELRRWIPGSPRT